MGANELALYKKGTSLCQGYTNTFFAGFLLWGVEESKHEAVCI